MNRIIKHPIPAGVAIQDDFKIRIRPSEGDWMELSSYRVVVDMHDPHYASMCTFEFEGEVEVEMSGPFYIYDVKIRPLSKNIAFKCDHKKVTFTLSEPMSLSIELNKERNANLHLFAQPIEEDVLDSEDDNVYSIEGNLKGIKTFGQEVMDELENMPKGRTLLLTPGLYYIRESILRLPSDTNIYLSAGAVVVGSLLCSRVSNIRIYGRGVIHQKEFNRHTGLNGIRISHSNHIGIEDLIFINPPHYTIYIGGSEHIAIHGIKGFSCEGWSDGIDIMSSHHISIKNVFLRNSDDCIAIYGSRWSYKGDSYDISVEGSVLWADVAHPTNIGTHGDYEQGGDRIHDISFIDIDILEHNEYQENYLGCLAISAGDGNHISDIFYRNIRIETFKHGRVIDLQIKCNPDYNPIPGKCIENVVFDGIYDYGNEEVESIIAGYNSERYIYNVDIKNYYLQDRLCSSIEEMPINIGDYVKLGD